MSQTVPPARISSCVLHEVFFSAKVPLSMSKHFLREANSIQIAGFHNTDISDRFKGNYFFEISRVFFSRDNAMLSGRTLIGAGG